MNCHIWESLSFFGNLSNNRTFWPRSTVKTKFKPVASKTVKEDLISFISHSNWTIFYSIRKSFIWYYLENCFILLGIFYIGISRNHFYLFEIQQDLEIHSLKEWETWRYTGFNRIPKHLRYTEFGQKPCW